ncbi:MAG: CoA-binding protein [Deltaproteobacteria bacterium]|nr:MAG: CoA-binding protein [Deltaproteobacteria bacterium]
MAIAAANKRTLSENESKIILSGYDVPTVREVVAADPEAAVKAAAEIGFPVVLKGHGGALAHKSELGLVYVGLEDESAVGNAAQKILSGAPEGLEGFLVQEFIKGRREFLAGIFRDPIYGPMVVFGLGGVLTEALSEISMRVAPLERADAEEMLVELRGASALMGEFRGEAPVDREAVIGTLLGLSKLAMERPDVAEVDLNPLIATPDGGIVAVDALVVIAPPEEPIPPRPQTSPEEIGKIFYPKSVAFIGATTGMGKWGQSLPTNLIAGGYEGEIYLVNPKGGEMWGRHVYKSISEIEGEIGLAVVSIPAKGVLELIPEFKEKGVKQVLLITSGFGETGEEGRDLEKRLVEAARDAEVVLFGPNTMGILNPWINLYITGVHTRPHAGGTALISQSGNMGVQLLDYASRQGIGIRAFGGSGNEAMVTIEDFMEAFEVDDETTTVLLYLESVKEGRRFLKSAKRVGMKKPVVVLKGGRTAAGSRAASSHTGAMASDYRVFQAVAKQSGIVSVSQPVEMLDASAAFSSLPLPKGRRVAIMTLGGGWGVVTSDLCAEHNLEVPELSQTLVSKLDGVLPPYWSRTNPVDLVGENDPDLPFIGVEALAAWDGCDAVINLGIVGRRYLLKWLLTSLEKVDPGLESSSAEQIQGMVDLLEQRYIDHCAKLMERYDKPIIGVELASGGAQRTLYEIAGAKYKGVFFSTPERAVRALSHMCSYQDFINR